MQNQVMKGDALYMTAPAGGVVSDNVYQFGSILGVAGVLAAQGASFALWVKGVYTLTKHSAEAWTVGALIYWENTNFYCTTSSGTGKS